MSLLYVAAKLTPSACVKSAGTCCEETMANPPDTCVIRAQIPGLDFKAYI